MTDWVYTLTTCGVSAPTVARWAPVFQDTIGLTTFSSPNDLAPFLGEILHESRMLTRMEEDLNYSAERMMAVWPGRFPTLESAQPYEHNSQALANKVYGGRMGNDSFNDGWTYRGRSPIGITGKGNYLRVGDLMGQDLVGIPDLLCQPHFALEACIHWWEDRIPDSMLGETTEITKLVQGGTLGLAERNRLIGLAQEALA